MRNSVAALVCAALALMLYLFTLAPTIGWGDSADLAMRMVYHGDYTFLGTSRDYPLYRRLGYLFQWLPVGDAGTRANILTAFFGAVAVGLVSFISGYVARSVFAAFAAGFAFMVSHTFWLMSVTAEVYSFNATLVFACYALLAVWWRSHKIIYLAGAALFAGLALSHHATGLLLCITIAPLVLMRIKNLSLLAILAIAFIFVLASFPYWERTAFRLLAGVSFLRALGLQTPANLFFDASPLHEFLKFIAYAAYNYFGFGLPLAAWGLFLILKKRVWEMMPQSLWLLLILYAGVTSSIPDKFNIYVLIYPVLAIAIGYGAAAARERFLQDNRLAIFLLVSLLLLPPLGYLATIHLTNTMSIDLVSARQIPYRDNAFYFMWPSKRGDVGARKYAEEALGAVDKNSVLIADYTLWRPLYFMQAAEGLRPDVRLVWVERLLREGVVSFIAKQPCDQPIFLATNSPPEYYQFADIAARYHVLQKGVVFQIVRQCKAPPPRPIRSKK